MLKVLHIYCGGPGGLVMKLRAACAVSVAVVVSSCGGASMAPSADNRPIPLEAILSQMKCEFALAFTKLDRSRLSFDGWFIDGKLTAKIITSDHAEGSISTPQMLPLGTGRSFGFNVGGKITASRTLDQVIDFIVSPYAASTEVCDAPRAPSVRSVDGLGIYKWLDSITKTVAGEPRMAVTNLTYTLDFGVKRTGDAGLDVSIVGIKASASADVSRDDINHLVLTMSPGDPAKANARSTLRRSSVRTPIKTPGGGNVIPFFLEGVALSNDTSLTEAQIQRIIPE